MAQTSSAFQSLLRDVELPEPEVSIHENAHRKTSSTTCVTGSTLSFHNINYNSVDLKKPLRQSTDKHILRKVFWPASQQLDEKCALSLESLVQRRTAELEDEKQKTDMLLYRMLPPSIANELKTGRHVKAQMFDSVSIYVSDIVSFTPLAARSSPIEIAELLHDLSSAFDDALLGRDVYKVQNIGDAYLVVSGLPKPNGDQHIVEICDVALMHLEVLSRFEIRHLPEEKLLMRLGLHTGPCAAGVAGHVMPRYCLFGDTVNTASRMESTGEALRIQMSQAMHDALKQFPGYITAPRGETSVKGKGMMHTYWLLGKMVPNSNHNGMA